MNRSKGPGSYHWNKLSKLGVLKTYDDTVRRATAPVLTVSETTWIALADYAKREGRTSSAVRGQIRRGTFGPAARQVSGRWQVQVAV